MASSPDAAAAGDPRRSWRSRRLQLRAWGSVTPQQREHGASGLRTVHPVMRSSAHSPVGRPCWRSSPQHGLVCHPHELRQHVHASGGPFAPEALHFLEPESRVKVK